MGKSRNLAHRGASGYAPENTLAAFRLAMEMGSDGLEFDVQLTRDGVPVVIHDEKLVRTTGATGMVWDYTWQQIQELDAGGWMGDKWKGEGIPSLEAVLSEFSGCFLNVELKNSILSYNGLEEKVINLLGHYCDPNQVIVSSFNPMSVIKMREIAPQIPVGFLFASPTNGLIEMIRAAGATAVHPDYATLSLDTVNSYHLQGLEVNTWTVDKEEEMRRMLEIRVDRIITNFPDRLNKILSE